MHTFLDALPEAACLSPAGKAALVAVAEPVQWPTGFTVLKPDKVCRYIWAIASGLTRTWYHKAGRDVTDWLSPEGTFAGSMVSFITGLPDRRGIEALEPTRAWAIHTDALNALYDNHADVERFGRLVVSGGLVAMQARFDALHFATAAQRYAQIMERQPGLLLRTPVSVLASYLGMSAETLSRIRSRMAGGAG